MSQDLRDTARRFATGKQRQVLSTSHIVFLVVAAAAPLAAMIGNLPIALARGDGVGTPAAFLFAGLTLLCFAVGYAAMSRHVVNTGAFYTYVAQGLGKPAGVGAAFTAVAAYVAFTIGLAAFLGYFLDQMLSQLGLHGSWVIYAAGGIVLVAALGYRSIDLSSRILGALMTAEILILAVFDIAVIAAKGGDALPLQSFAPEVALAPGLGIALMVAYTSFIGFESAALYGEEAKDPARSVPIATYVSVVLIAVFYLLTAWVTIGAAGPDQVKALATADGGLMMFDLISRYAGETMSNLTSIVVCTSLLASYLAIHNGATRYIFALSREKLLPPALGRFHKARYSPSNASLTVSALTALLVLGVGLLTVDPYQVMIPTLVGFGTLGIIFLQGFAAVAIVAYLGRRRGETTGFVLVASTLGALGLIAATLLVTGNFTLLATADLPFVAWLPLAYPALVAAGVGFALWLRQNRPLVYAALAEAELRTESARRAVPQIRYDGRYCIVGGGPCGLLAARAFRLAGIPYDQFERHSEVGGIWAIENPGSPMYESAHFISSKYTSPFYGLPMPEAYPDYPDYRQIHAYIRDFAEAFDLAGSIQFGTSVEQAEPIGPDAAQGWRVRLSTGEVRHYKGLVCANGVTWHPSLPSYPGLDRFRGEVRHSVTYRDPAEFAGKRVLIVGAGNSGVDIACDAARSAATAAISLRRGYHFVPKHIFGVPIDVFLGGGLHPPKGVVIPDDPSEMLAALVGDLTRFGLKAPDHKVMESHPIMNTQILHYLAHGDLTVKPDVALFTETGVVFTDGTAADFDLVLCATGYEYRIPYLDPDLFTWKNGRPELYLNILHRRLRGLSVVGFVEFASAGYQRFDEMAQMAALDAYLEQSGANLADWRRMKQADRPDLRGAAHYIDSPRHTAYVNVGVYRKVLAGIRQKFGWPDPDDALYAPMLKQPQLRAAE